MPLHFHRELLPPARQFYESCTVRSWVLHKKVDYVKLGRRVFLRMPDLEALIERSVVPGGRVANEK